MTPKTQQRRLERAGFRYVTGWIPASDAERIESEIAQHEPARERILAEPALPRGRPRKDA